MDSKSSEIVELKVQEQEDIRDKLKVAQERASTWRNRALMARQQNNEDLVKQALLRMWQYQAEAACLLGKKPPPRPKDIPPADVDVGEGPDPGTDYPGNPPWRPYDPSRVPRKPLPFSGGTEVALPLPNQEDSD